MPPLQKSFKVAGVTVGKVDLELNQIICKGIRIGNISSSYLKEQTSMRFILSGINVACSIPKFQAHLDGVSIGSGSGTAKVYQTSVQDTLQITGDGRLARKATNLQCGADVKTTIKLKLSALSSLVNLILKWAEGQIDSKIDSVICDEFNTLINTNLTNVLLALDTAMTPYIPPQCCTPNPPPPVPAGMINWRDSKIIDGVDYVLDYLLSPSGPLSINKLVDRLTDNSGVISVPSGFSSLINATMGALIRIDIENVTIGGLDTFKDLNLFGTTTLNPYVLNTSLEAESLNVTMGLTLQVMLGQGDTVSGGNLTERFLLNLYVDKPTIQLSTLLALRESYVRGMRMGQLVLPSCIATALHAVNFTEISVNFTLGALKLITKGGDIEGELDRTIDTVLEFFIDNYKSVVPDVLHGVIMGPLTDILNEELEKMRAEMAQTGCPSSPSVGGGEFIDWTNGTLSTFFAEANKFVDASGPLSINWILQQLLGADDDGVAHIRGELASFKVQDNLRVVFRDLDFYGVMSFANFSFFNPLDNRTLLSYMDWAKREGPVNISLGIDTIIGEAEEEEEGRQRGGGGGGGGHLATAGSTVKDSFRLSFHFANLSLDTTGVLLVNKASFSNLTVEQVGNVYCDASALSDGRFVNLDLSVDECYMRLAGGHSSSLHKLEEAIPQFDLLSKELINYLFNVGSPFIQTQINQIARTVMDEGAYVCAGEPVPSPSTSPSGKKLYEKAVFLGTVLGVGSFLILVSLGWYCRRKWLSNHHQEDGKGHYNRLEEAGPSLNSPQHHNSLDHSRSEWEEVKGDQAASSSDHAKLLSSSSSSSSSSSFPPWNCLAANSHIPIIFRFGVPIALCGNIATFIISNMGTGAAVEIDLHAGDFSPELPTLFEFSLSNTIVDMWKAKVYPLSILVAVFSGGWPYLKLLLMQVCWLFPLSWLSEKRRESLLIALDALGKWSLLDAYVLSLMLVAFRFSISNPESEIGVNFFTADVLVEPGLGFYTFLMATITSLLTTHIVLHYHRFPDESKAIAPGGAREALCNHVYPGASYGLERNQRVACTWLGKLLVSFLLFLGVCVILAGSIIESFRFEFKGLASLFLGDDATRTYSLLSVTKAIPQASSNPSGVGVIWIQAVFYTVSFAVPLCHLVVMMFLWWVPMTAKVQYSVFYFTEVLNAWSALDVFVVSIIAAILEIQQFAKFLVGDKCDVIDAFLKQHMTQYLGGYNTCFTVIATLSDGCWVLFFACLISLVVSQTVMRTCHKAMHDRLEHQTKASSSSVSSESTRSSSALENEEGASKCLKRIGNCFKSIGLLRIVPRNARSTNLESKVSE